MEKSEKIIEAILFWKGEPVGVKKLAEYADCTTEEVNEALKKIKAREDGGVTLVENDGEAMLGSSPDAGNIIEKLTKEELSKELTRAALETLSVVLYLAPVRRSQIDFVRGVNSQFSLRHLEIRGLVEKTQSEEDSRVHLYKPTFDCLSYLGISSLEELPGFADTKAKLRALEETKETDASE